MPLNLRRSRYYVPIARPRRREDSRNGKVTGLSWMEFSVPRGPAPPITGPLHLINADRFL